MDREDWRERYCEDPSVLEWEAQQDEVEEDGEEE